MSDFFASLVERSMGTASTVRPRLASRFEPAASPRVPAVDIVEMPADTILRDGPSQTGFSTRGRPQPSQAPESSQLEFRHALSSTAEPTAPWSGPASHASVAWTSTSIGLHQTVAAEDSRARETTGDRADSHPAESDRYQPLTPVSAPAPRTNELVARTDPPLDRSAFLASLRAVEPERQTKPYAPVAGHGALVANLPPREVSAWQGEPTPWRNPVPTAAAVTMPTSDPPVHVTIGRIEVRAISEGRAPVRERSASPVMGLDQYLRSQAQRGTR